MSSRQCPNCGRRFTGQRAYVRHLLEEAGKRGVTTAQFLAAGAGNRFGARVHELRHDHGLDITEAAELYVLVGVAAGPTTPESACPADGGTGREVVDGPWRLVQTCMVCCQIVKEKCPRHGTTDVRLGWHGDFTPDSLWATSVRAARAAKEAA